MKRRKILTIPLGKKLIPKPIIYPPSPKPLHSFRRKLKKYDILDELDELDKDIAKLHEDIAKLNMSSHIYKIDEEATKNLRDLLNIIVYPEKKKHKKHK